MLQTLFALPIYRTSLNELDLTEVYSIIQDQFASTNNNVNLEKNGGVSTYATNKHLHTLPAFQELCNTVLYHANLYWKALDINDGLQPVIDECWSNKHVKGSYTDLHSHSLHPLVVSFYLEAPTNCGGIIFANPMEYGITHMPYNSPVEEKVNTTVHVSTRDMLIFPGWLRHKTEASNTDDERIVITFNLRYEGRYLDSQQPYVKVQGTPMPESMEDPVVLHSDSSMMDYLFQKLHIQEVIIGQLKQALIGTPDGR